ncbi:hypothetical protein BC827DRAFT_786475 [Russula dissimulans]|nr:hypothetical protein BC827DRAFT_786475 [Russula dissimulans]
MAPSNVDANVVLAYLGLALDYEPSPSTAPVPFLTKHLHQLPSHILHWFSAITTPQQRAALVLVRNRRFNFIHSNPPEFSLPAAKRQWPTLWEGPQRIGHEDAREEKEWADTAFLGGERRAYVGKLGTLLGGYEEERHLERGRQAKLGRGRQDVFIPEEDESSEDDRDHSRPGTPESEQALEELFLRRVRERFIYGHLEWDRYDTVDWDEGWDREERDREERWFDDDDE